MFKAIQMLVRSLLKISIFTLAIFSGWAGVAQKVEFFSGTIPRFLTNTNDTLKNPFTGGYIAPQFNAMDLNGDGLMDLVIFDRATGKFSTFVKEKAGSFEFKHAPEFAFSLPESFYWVVMKDYNCDGKEDIFTNGSQIGNLRIYKNTSTAGKISFEMVTDMLTDRDGINISCDAIDYPSIVDIDGDGDLDFLYLQMIWGFVAWYKNFRVEDNLSCDSLRFDIEDYCWGSFAESGITRELILGAQCPFRKKNGGGELDGHAGSTLLHLDMDGDGDLEVLIGDVGYRDLYLAKNGRVERGWIRDTIVSYDSIFPASKPLNLRSFPAAFYLDLDDDGIKDLVLAPNDPNDGQKVKQMWLYKNHGQNNKPDFRFVRDDFIQNQTVDIGGNSAPVLYDWNGDGLEDLLLAFKEPGLTDVPKPDQLALYLNVGTDTLPIFKLENSDLLRLSQLDLYGLKPAFGDLNGDGKADILLGNFRGTMPYLRNTGAPGDTTFVLETMEFQDIWPCNASAPQIIDLDRDGVNDLLIGCAEGILNFYKNKGNATNPVFSETPDIDTFGRVIVGEPYWFYTAFAPDGTPIDSVKLFFPEGFATPQVTDLNRDGRYDMVVGSRSGKIFIFMDIEAKYARDSFPEELNYYFNQLTETRGIFAPGGRSVPFVGMLDSDTMPDIIIGNTGGGLFLLNTQKGPRIPVNLVRTINTIPLHIYPNPAREEINVQRNLLLNDAEATVELFNITGTLVRAETFRNGQHTIRLDINNIAPGMYIVRYKSADFVGNGKVIIQQARP